MKKIIKYIIAFLLIIVCFFVLSGYYFIAETIPLRKADVIVVLGNPTLPDGKIGITQKSRVDKGKELYDQGLAKKILFAGGAAWNEYVEAETMKAYAIAQGIPEAHILIETQSTNTDENAALTYKILKKNKLKKVIVVSSSYHTRRACHLFCHYPLVVQTAAAPYPKGFNLHHRMHAIINEYYGFIRHFLVNCR